MIKKITTDIHALVGASGFFATITLQSFNTLIATAVGIATLAYMFFRALREWKKWEHETQKQKTNDKKQLKMDL